jgi:MacB-like protein
MPPSYFPEWQERSDAATRIVSALYDSGVVEAAAVADTRPFASGRRSGDMAGNGEADTVTIVDKDVRTRLVIVGPRFFDTLDLEPLRGRTFDRRDSRNATPAAVATESFVRRRFANADPLGTTVEFQQRRWFIVGVVPDLRASELDGTPSPTLSCRARSWVTPTARGTGIYWRRPFSCAFET